MLYTIETLQSDLQALKKHLGANLSSADRDAILDQLRELARQVRATQGLIAQMSGDRQPITTPTDRLSFGKGLQGDKVQRLRKAVEVCLGPNGGQSVPYNKSLAFKLLAQGTISAGQHKLWKACDHLPENVDLRQAKAEPAHYARLA